MTSQGENSGSLKQLRHEGEIHGVVAAKARKKKHKTTSTPLQSYIQSWIVSGKIEKGFFVLFRFAAKQRESKRGFWTPLTFLFGAGKADSGEDQRGRLSALNR